MTQRLEELRTAPIVNGGVGLVVWCGGVAKGVSHLVRKCNSIYREIARLASTVASVNVMLGASAGGTNEAALAAATFYDSKFRRRHSVSLETRAFANSLRAPLGEYLGLILRGEQYFILRMTGALEERSFGSACAPAERVQAGGTAVKT